MLTIDTLNDMRTQLLENINNEDFDDPSATYCDYVIKKIIQEASIRYTRMGIDCSPTDMIKELVQFFVTTKHPYEELTDTKNEISKAEQMGYEVTDEIVKRMQNIMAINLRGSLGEIAYESACSNGNLSDEMKEKLYKSLNLETGGRIVYNISSILRMLELNGWLNFSAIKLIMTLYMEHERHHSIQDIDFIKKSVTVTVDKLSDVNNIAKYNNQPHEVDANLHGAFKMVEYAINHFNELF